MAAFWYNLSNKTLRLFVKIILAIITVIFVLFILVLVLGGLTITIPALGFVTLPFSNNYNPLLQGAFNGLGFIGNSWQSLAGTVNSYSLCLDSLFISWNKIARFAVAVFGNIASVFSITYPSWWTARGFDHVRNFQVALHTKMVEIEQLKARIVKAELASQGYSSMEDAPAYVKLHAIHAADMAGRREYKRAFLDVVPELICSLINGVADILIDLIDLFSPFFLTFLDLLLTAINYGKANEPGEFALLLVEFIFSQILAFLASIGLDIGQCILDLPNSLILCMFPTCDYDDISDSGALIFACAFSPVCTVSSSTVSNAGDVLFQCLQIQSIIDFGLTIWNGILSLQSVITTLQNFFTNLWNSITSLKSVVNSAYDLLKKIASRFNINLRSFGIGDIHVDDPHMVLDRIVLTLGFEKPYGTRKVEIDALQDIYDLVQTVKNTTSHLDMEKRETYDYHPHLDAMRSLIIANVTHHQHQADARIIWNVVCGNIEKYYSQKMRAFVEAARQMQEVMHLSVHDPLYIDRKLQLDRILNPGGVLNNLFGNYNASFVKPVTFDNSNLHAAANRMMDIVRFFNSSMNSPLIQRAFKPTTSKKSYTAQSPIWAGEPTFRGRFDGFMNMHNRTFHNTSMFRTLNVYRDIMNDPVHYRQIQLLANAVRNATQVFHWVFSQGDHHTVTVPMIRARLSAIPMAHVVSALRHVATTARTRMGVTVQPERAARAKMWIARWVDEDVHHEMQRSLIDGGFRAEDIQREAKETEDRYFATMKRVIQQREEISQPYRYYEHNRFALIASITGTSIGGTLLYSGAPISIVASLLPAIGGLLLPVVGLLVGFIPQVLSYLMQKATNLISNAFAGGEYLYPDLATNLITRLGPTILDMYNFEPSPFLIQAMFQQTAEFASDVIDDVGQYAVYAIACNVPPIPLLQCPAWPTKDDTANSYFMKLVFFPMDAVCIDDSSCPGGFCRRAVDPNDPDGCHRYCTKNNPCNPLGRCINPPLLPTGNCMSPGFFNVSFSVDCPAVGYTTKIYQQSNAFQDHGLTWNFLFSNAGFYFIGQCMVDSLVAIRAVIRLFVHGYMLPAQGLFSGLLTNIPFVPSAVGSLGTITVVQYFITPRIQSVVIDVVNPTMVWFDQHVWIVNWFGIPSPFRLVMSIFRYDNYAQNPPLGSPEPADNLCPVLNISYVLIGGTVNVVILVLFFALLIGGILTIIVDVIFLLLLPLLYIWHVSKVANNARLMHQKGMLSYEYPPQNNQVMEWHNVNNEIVGAPRVRGSFNIGAVWPSVKHAMKNSNFANDILMGKQMCYSKYIIDPREGIPIRHSRYMQVVRKSV